MNDDDWPLLDEVSRAMANFIRALEGLHLTPDQRRQVPNKLSKFLNLSHDIREQADDAQR